MLRGGRAIRGQRGLLLGALLAFPACGFVVGFDSRECSEECSNESLGGAGGTDNGGADTSLGGPEVSSANTGGAMTGALTTSGSDGNSGSSTGGASGTGGTGGLNGTGGTETASGTGGESASGGDGGSSAGGSGSGGTETTSGGDGGSNAGGDGGTAGSAGSTTTTTTTSAVGGATSVGGSGGSGGTGGTESPCSVFKTINVTAAETGPFPAHLMLAGANAVRPWDVTWLDGDDVYFAAYYQDGSEVMSPTVIDDSGMHGSPVVTAQSLDAFVAYGELDTDDASIVMKTLNPQTTTDPVEDITEPLEGEAAPDVMGIALRGTSSDALVAAIGADESGVIALFIDGKHERSEVVPGPFTAVTPLDLTGNFALASIGDGALQVALVSHDLETIGEAQPIMEASPTTSERSLAGAKFGDGAALVWVEASGIHITTVNASGVAADPVQVSYGDDHILPMVDVSGTQVVVSWIDASTDTLYFRRFPTGLADEGEPAFKVAEGVAETRYGFDADSFSTTPMFGFAFSANRLQMKIVTCPMPAE